MSRLIGGAGKIGADSKLERMMKPGTKVSVQYGRTGPVYTGTVIQPRQRDVKEIWVRLEDKPASTIFFPVGSNTSRSEYTLLEPVS